MTPPACPSLRHPLPRGPGCGPGRGRLRLLALAALAALVMLAAGCGHPPELIGVAGVTPGPVAGATERRIFIATTRAPAAGPGQLYSPRRSGRLGLAEVTVSIPPGHVAGRIERPRRLPPDPRREMTVAEATRYTADRDFIAAVDAELARRVPADREVLLFVHGYNNTPSDSVLRLAQFVQDSGFRGVPMLFSWPSAGRRTHYVYDLNSALAARPLLEQASSLLIRTRAGGFDVFAHSMGALLVTEVMVQSDLQNTLGSSGHLHNVMLAAPDIDLDLFRAQLGQIRNRRGNVFVFVSGDDRALALSRRLSGGVDRVGDATAAELAGLNVTVIDLARVGDSASGTHAKFAASPEVVKLIGAALGRDSFSGRAEAPAVVDILDGIPVLERLLPQP